MLGRETNGPQRFVLIFQARKPQPCVYMRCLLQTLIFYEMRVLGTMSIKELIFEDLAEIVLPADILVDRTNENVEAPQAPGFQIAKKMDDYVARVGQVSSSLPRFHHEVAHSASRHTLIYLGL